MKRVLASIVGSAIALALLALPASAAGAQKVDLLGPHGVAFCNGSGASGSPGFGFAVVNHHAGNVAAEIAMKGVAPNTTYNVRLIQTNDVADCFRTDATLTTNGQGNGNVHVSEPIEPGATSVFVAVVTVTLSEIYVTKTVPLT
jgi:hypothetical protein